MAFAFVRSRFAEVAVLSLAVIGSVVAGTLVAVAGTFAALILAGALVATFILFLPASVGLWLFFIIVLLVVGQLTYFGDFPQAFWVPYLMAILIWLKLPLEILSGAGRRLAGSRENPAFLICVYFFFLLFAFSVVLNKTGAPWVVATSKNYLFVWSIMFLIGLGSVEEDSLEKLWRFFLWVSVLQLPFAIVERLFFSKRRWTINWDAVVGTFGGNPDGGGASGTMAFFLVFTMLLASAFFSSKKISAKFHWTVLVCAMATVALAEVKVVFIILPIGYFWLFRKQIPHNLGKTMLFGSLLAIVLAGVLYAYISLYQSASKNKVTIDSSISYFISGETNPNFYNPLTREVSRIGAIVNWWVLNPMSSYGQFLFGHGPGASRDSQTVGEGVAARKYPFTLSTSTASVLLWDLGLIGYATFVFVLLLGALGAEQAARNPAVPRAQQCILRANATALLLAAMMTVYNRDANDSAALQFLIAAMLGHLMFIAGKYARSTPAGAPLTESAFGPGRAPNSAN